MSSSTSVPENVPLRAPPLSSFHLQLSAVSQSEGFDSMSSTRGKLLTFRSRLAGWTKPLTDTPRHPLTQRILPGIVAGDAAPDAPVQDPETPTAPSPPTSAASALRRMSRKFHNRSSSGGTFDFSSALNDAAGDFYAEFTEPPLQYLHVRLLEADLREEAENVFAKVRFNGVKLDTVVRSKTKSPRWNEEFIVGYHRPDGPQAPQDKPFVSIAVKKFCRARFNTTLADIKLPVSCVPCIDTEIDPEPLPTTWAAESNENMLQASMWFEQAYHNYTLPTVAQVTVVLGGVEIDPAARGKRPPTLHAVVQHSDRWVKQPLRPDADQVKDEDPIVFDVCEPSSVISVTVADLAADNFFGMIRFRVSTLPTVNEWVTTQQTLYVRKEGRHSAGATIHRVGRLTLRLRLDVPNFRWWCKAYTKPPSAPKFRTAVYEKHRNLLVKQQNDAVATALKQPPMGIPRSISTIILHTRVEAFSMAECKVASNRFMGVWDRLQGAAAQWRALCNWTDPLVTAAVIFGWLCLIYFPTPTFQALLLLCAISLARLWLHHSDNVEQWLGVDPSLFGQSQDVPSPGPSSPGPEDPPAAVAPPADAEDPAAPETDGVRGSQLSRNPSAILQAKLAFAFVGGMRVQRTITAVAALGEHCEAAIDGGDQTITALAFATVVVVFLLSWGGVLRHVLFVAGLFVLRPPRFRNDTPSALVCVLGRLPCRGDRTAPTCEDYSDRSVMSLHH